MKIREESREQLLKEASNGDCDEEEEEDEDEGNENECSDGVAGQW